MLHGIEQIKQDRLNKLENIKKAKVNPYPSHSNPEYSCQELLGDFDKLTKEKSVSVAGRVRSIRGHGGSTFVDVDDSTAKIQVYFKQDEMGDKPYDFFGESVDVGDFIEVTGSLFETKRGEKTILAQSFNVLTKTLAPLPEKWSGLKDLELRLRQRYLDLLMNPDTRNIFLKRTKFINAFRNHLEKNDFLEVETPVLENIPGGAEAEPFTTHHNTLDIDLYLRISLELHLKRLVVGGFNNVFEIGKVFRNEGMSREHLQEFTMLELYRAYWDYEQLMDFVEETYKTVIKKTFGKLEFEYEGTKLNFDGKWKKIKYLDAFKEFSGIDLAKIKIKEDLLKEIKNKDIKIKLERSAGLGRIIDQVYKKTVRPKLTGPIFLIDHPAIISPLAKKHADNPDIVERFQIIILGSELGNGFSELNDPIDQKERFEAQIALREAGDKEAQMMDEDFVKALEYGMPPTAGFGIGIDRLFMILSGVDSIRETVLFPTMRPE